ncbi:MAG: bi-domain-containing oxidoreductase [Alphaproteobacteria bacterium]|jgi:polar amino acid transport system substrate-binding protein|nr:bi-domain-containing oxidoreductase [Alphaproteobacteria bacterium]
MKQVTQTLRTGALEVNDVPVPTLHDTFVLVRSSASVISAGTEKTKIDMGHKNLLQKAMARPDLVRQVIKKVHTEGIAKTLQTVRSRLGAPSPLGYSLAGEVCAVGGLVEGLAPGDRVSCAGAGYANHAEFVAIPKNLVVKVPEAVSDEEAAFATLGSIALQGIRLAEPRLGETFLVLGLGLLGQITVQLLRANGCNVIGTDLEPSLVALSEKYGAVGVSGDVVTACLEMTGGHGVDGVLVCAATSSNQPIELCGEITRQKGRVVVIGAVRLDIPRENFYRKEIDVVISCSYGPGRYDPFYEEAGHDYPYSYVRFTEQRNMETFLGLVAQKKLDITGLITHRFPLDEAVAAYSLIEGARTEPYLGIVLLYDGGRLDDTRGETRIPVTARPIDKDKLGISFFGAGNYATASLLPHLKSSDDVALRGLVTASGRTAQGVASQFGFEFCAGEFSELLGEDTDAIMVATRHDSHANSVVAALDAEKHVFVEKPLGLSVEELAAVHAAYHGGQARQIMVGFNRRFAPLTQDVIKHFADAQSPLVINIRVNAGVLPPDHWMQDPVAGGGRMIGEGCHFVDLASALCGSSPSGVYGIGSAKANRAVLLNDNLSVSLTFENGSIANVIYTADGATAMPKEYVEVFGAGRSAVIIDFKELLLYEGDRKSSRKKLLTQDKGQRAMLAAWLKSLRSGEPCVSYESLMKSSLATVMAVESLTVAMPMAVDFSVLEQK